MRAGADGLVWQLRMWCLRRVRHCVFVHMHHGGVEDAMSFRRVRAVESRLALSALSGALEELSVHLPAHPDTEEAALEPVPCRLER